MDGYNPLIFKEDRLFILNQKKLPITIEYFEAKNVEDICFAIKNMIVRGAPLIGIVAAFGVYLSVYKTKNTKQLSYNLKQAIDCLSKTRPTAVNLFFAINSMKNTIDITGSILQTVESAKQKAFDIWNMQKRSDIKIGENGAEFLKNKKNILTHCNTGTLATGGIGTALGIIKIMHKKGYLESVFVDETRPYFQGSRLTAFELEKDGIDYRIVTDNSCGILMKKGLIDAVVVGADRIAKNGDTANKIGTYCIAVMAKKHGVPFVVAAPESTIDRDIESMDEIVVEERNELEILNIQGYSMAPKNAKALNYSFDLTDSDLISAIITEKNIYIKRFGL